MNELTLSVVVFLSALIVLFSGIPIWAGLAGISLVYILIFSPHILGTVPHVLFGSMDSFAMLSIPLFILMSAPLAASQASKDLYEAMHRWVYRLPGGLGVSTMMAAGVFAALCGSSPATAGGHRRHWHTGNAPEGLFAQHGLRHGGPRGDFRNTHPAQHYYDSLRCSH